MISTLANCHLLFEFIEKVSVSSHPSIFMFMSSFPPHMEMGGERAVKHPKGRNTVSLRIAREWLFPADGCYYLSHGIKVSSVGREARKFIPGEKAHQENQLTISIWLLLGVESPIWRYSFCLFYLLLRGSLTQGTLLGLAGEIQLVSQMGFPTQFLLEFWARDLMVFCYISIHPNEKLLF